MGLFDGQIEKLGNKLSNSFKERALDLEKEWAAEKDPGKTMLLKIKYNIYNDIASK
jgi:hypothetical protein